MSAPDSPGYRCSRAREQIYKTHLPQGNACGCEPATVFHRSIGAFKLHFGAGTRGQFKRSSLALWLLLKNTRIMCESSAGLWKHFEPQSAQAPLSARRSCCSPSKRHPALRHLMLRGLCASVVVLGDSLGIRRRVTRVSGIFFRYARIERGAVSG